MAIDWEDQLRASAARSSDTEDQKRENTERMIRDAIGAHPRLRSESINVFAQGSYKNNTNVRADSDVDIAVEFTGAIFTDYQHGAAGLTREHFGIGPYTGGYPWPDLKDDVENALVTAFGRGPVTRGNKAINVRESSRSLAADVVACYRYKRYVGPGAGDFHQGIQIHPDHGPRVENWPAQHYARGVAKNDQTGRRFKRMVRALKRLENDLVDQRLISAAVPSFLMECLVYNVDNGYFQTPTYFQDFVNVLTVMEQNTRTDAACEKWLEVSELKWLFRPSQKWTRQQAHELAVAALNYIQTH